MDRLPDEYRRGREVSLVRERFARDDEHSHLWPPLRDEPREFESVERTGHVDVRQHDAYISPALQDLECFVGILSLEHPEASFPEDIDLCRSHERLILHEENDWLVQDGSTRLHGCETK